MGEYEDSGGSGSRTAILIVGIVGGVVLVFLLVCGGLVYLGFKTMKETFEPMVENLKQMAQDIEQSQAVANDFLENIRANRLEEAYQSTTESFKKRVSRKGFEELVQKHPELKQQDVFPQFDVNQNQSQPPTQPFSGPYRYRYSVQGKDGKEPLEFKITVAKENGTLKVDQLTVYQEEKPK
jgi:hypothetical protein